MIYSEARKTHLLQKIIDNLYKEDYVDLPGDEESLAMRWGKNAFAQWDKAAEEMQQAAENKVRSLKRQVVEGSPEWNTLYSKYLEEELVRRGY